jgi:hypothetical protein
MVYNIICCFPTGQCYEWAASLEPQRPARVQHNQPVRPSAAANHAVLLLLPRIFGAPVAYTGPGQAVLYPVLNLRQLERGARAYVEGIEDTVVAALGVWLT